MAGGVVFASRAGGTCYALRAQMLSTARAERLARRAARRRGAASRGALAGRAWRTLTVACECGDQRAIDAVWRAWLRHPDDEWWALLTRSRGSDDLAEAVFAAAVDPARDAGSRAALGAFCARHGMSPDDDVRQVLFYALAGQHERLRAADSGGTLLAIAYQDTAPPTRTALRQALAAVSGLEYVRVLAAGYCRDGHPVPLANEDVRYLAWQLAARGDWERLWRLVRDLPLAEAVAAMPYFGTDWRPADEAGRRLFTSLGGTSPATISAVAAEAVQHIWVSGGDPGLHGGVTFAPDGSEIGVGQRWKWDIAFTMMGVIGDPLRDATTTRYALPDGRRIGRYHAHPGTFIHLGESVAYVKGHKRYHVIRRGPHGRERLWKGKTWPHPRLCEIPGGFVVNIGERLLAGTAVVGTGLREVWPPGPGPERTGTLLYLASEPVSGRLAFTTRQPGEPPSIIVLDAGFQIIGQAVDPSDRRVHALLFCGQDLLLGLGVGHIYSWRIGPPMTYVASTEVQGFTAIMPLARSSLIAVHSGLRNKPWTWLDARTLTPAEGPPALRDARDLWVSPSGDHAAVQRPYGELEVRDLRLDEVAGLIDRPLAIASPADLATVAAVQALRLGPQAITAIGLLRACLEHRFGPGATEGREPDPWMRDAAARRAGR